MKSLAFLILLGIFIMSCTENEFTEPPHKERNEVVSLLHESPFLENYYLISTYTSLLNGNTDQEYTESEKEYFGKFVEEKVNRNLKALSEAYPNLVDLLKGLNPEECMMGVEIFNDWFAENKNTLLTNTPFTKLERDDRLMESMYVICGGRCLTPNTNASAAACLFGCTNSNNICVASGGDPVLCQTIANQCSKDCCSSFCPIKE